MPVRPRVLTKLLNSPRPSIRLFHSYYAKIDNMIFEIVLLFQKFSSFYFIMDKTTKKENRGGAREGAGRKGLGNTKRVSICLTDELVPVFKQLGGAKWLRCELERVAEPARTLDTDQILVPAMNPTHLSIPVYECGVQAGFPSPAESYIDKSLDLNEYLVANPASTFFVADRSPEPKNGDIVIMSINNEFTVKRYVKDDKGLRLLPESSNPIYKPILPKDYDEWRFIGVVKYTIKSN